MAVLQNTFSEDPVGGFPGMEADGELSNIITRVLESGTLGFGKAAFRGAADRGCLSTQTLAATSAAQGTNVGNGTMGAVTVSGGARIGAYTVTIVEPATNAGAFVVTGPNGQQIGHGNAASAFSAGGLAFTLADGSTDFSSGDSFVITVTGNALLGFTIANKALPVTSDRPADTFAANDNVRIKNRGKIWVLAAASVAKGDQVFITTAGAITNVATGNIPAIGWEFDDTVASGAPVRVVRR